MDWRALMANDESGTNTQYPQNPQNHAAPMRFEDIENIEHRSEIQNLGVATVADNQNTTYGIIWRIAERYGLGLSDLESAAGKDWPEVLSSPDLAEALAGAVATRRMRERGERPQHYTQRATCAGCGPVWLWEGAPLNVLGCPWCFNRISGKPIPTPG